MARQTPMPRWIIFAIGYFALAGLVVHLALGGLWLARPDLVWMARERVAASLGERLGLSPGPSAADARQLRDEIDRMLPEWSPVPASASAPAPRSIRIGQRTFRSFEDALAAIRPGETLDIGPGVYDEPLIVRADRVTILGHGHAVLEKGAAEGKGSMVIKGNGVEVRNLECRQIAVPDGNGACLRLEGRDLFVEHVYFHDSEQGILTSPDPGFVHLRDSRFERLGARGQSHGIYIGGGKLLIEDSLFLASKDEGHEIKTRARLTSIVRSLIASLDGRDSRLIDAANGGTLTVEGCVLEQGPNTSNSDAIGFALESPDRTGPGDRLLLRDNLILLERNGPNRLLHLGSERVQVEVFGNLIVSAQETGYERDNLVYKTRKQASLPEYPALPLKRLRQSPSTPRNE